MYYIEVIVLQFIRAIDKNFLKVNGMQ